MKIFSILIIGCFVLSCSISGKQESQNNNKLNIVFILTDDQRVGTLGFEGNEIIQTPNIDQLARTGVYFDNSFVTTPICCASRASILTGQYARRHGINDFKTDFSDSALSQTYPSLLREAGYFTGFVGKYGVGNKEDKAPKDKFDYWKGLHASKYGGQGHYWQDTVHLTKLMELQALEFLDSVPGDKPFCLSISFKAPHAQDTDPDQFLYDTTRYNNLYKNDVIHVSDLADDKYWEMFPDFFKREDSETRIRWRRRFSSPELYQKMTKGYYRLITGVDDAVGAIRNKLKHNGLSENTIIIYTGDNGFYLGERGLAGNWFSHEESIRVPLIVYNPQKENQKLQRVDEIALNIDMAPTILDLAGLTIPEKMQGMSLLPLMNGIENDWRTDFFFEHRFIRNNIPESEGVVSLDRKYIRYIEEEPDYEYLYDLQKDPDEINNYIDSLDYVEDIKTLKLRYQEFLRDLK